MDNLGHLTLLLMGAFLLAALFGAGNDRVGWERILIKVNLLAGVIACGVVLFNATVMTDVREPGVTASSDTVAGAENGRDGEDASSTADPESPYSDPRWPTSNTELMAIPEADRWYNSRRRVGSHGTIVGPVADVDVLDDRVMVNIGADYPDPDRVQIVIWAERWEDFQDILSEIDVGDPWVSVSGEISEYDGVAEIDVNDSDTEWRWWADVE